MNLELRQKALLFAALGALTGACSGEPGTNGTGCTVTTSADGSSTIRCTDGTSATLRNGMNGTNGADGAAGTSCTVTATDAGVRVITCSDGTRVEVPNGSDGTSCTLVSDLDAGTRMIRCADGTSTTITNGRDGANATVLGNHGSAHLLSTGAYAGGAKVLARATITAATATPDGRVTVAFRVTDRGGRAINSVAAITANIARLAPQAASEGSNRWVPYIYRTQTVVGTGSWPAPAGTTAIQANRESNGVLTNNRDGTYSYAFATNLTTAMMGTTAIAYQRNRTHRVVIMMGGASGPTADAFFDFVPDGSAVAERRDIVQTATCQGCHNANEFRAHGGDRLSVESCASCHVPGSVDPHSGESLDLPVMIHKIHAGGELSRVRGPDGIVYDNPATTVNEAADNGRYAIWGFGDRPISWEHVAFPAVLSNCTACHTGPGAQVDNWNTRPSRTACGSCHDDVNFATGANHGNATMMPGAQTSDATCTTCHRPTGGIAPIVTLHNWTARQVRNQPEFNATLTMTPPANGRFYVAGEAPVVSIALRDAVTGTVVDHTTLGEDTTAEGCPTTSATCPPRDGLLRTAALFVHGPRAHRMPVLTTAARSQIFSPTTGPFNLTGAGASLILKLDQGADVRTVNSTGGDVLRAGLVTVPVAGGTFVSAAAATTDEVVTWLNANAAFAARARAWNDAGRVGLRSRNLGPVHALQLQASAVNTAVFGGDVTVKMPVGFTTSNNVSRRVVAANNDPKANWTTGAITYQLDPVDDLAPGTYVVSIEFADRGRVDDANYVTPTVARITFQVGQAAEEPLVAGNCNSCHQNSTGAGFILDPSRHNKIFNNTALDQCGACHDNQPQSPTGAGWTGARPISRRVHAIHFGASLNFPLSTVDYSNGDSVPGRNWNITFPQDVRNCETCHTPNTTSGTWATRPQRLACSGCHDSDAAMSHMRVATFDPTPTDPWSGDEQESCATCH